MCKRQKGLVQRSGKRKATSTAPSPNELDDSAYEISHESNSFGAKQLNKSPQFEIVGGRVDDERNDLHKCWVCSDSSQWPDECQKLAVMNYDE